MNNRIYLDVYFVVNSVMNYLLICAVRNILKLTPRRWRYVLASGLGGLWAALLVCFPVLPGWLELSVTWLCMGGIMVILAFGPLGISDFIKTLCSLWLVSAACAGVLEMLGRQVRSGWYFMGGMIPRQWSALSLVCGMAGIYFGISGCVLIVKANRAERKNLFQVTLHYRGREKTVTALWDTGNQLHEPYGHQPVHVITYEACASLCETVTRMIYIPFRSVGKDHGMLPGIQVDRMEVAQEGKTVRVVERPWLAISREPLSGRGQYEMLLHMEE